MQKLIDQFTPYIKYLYTLKFAGVEFEDFLQEGTIGLFEATVKFDNKKSASFKYFAEKLIKRRLNTFQIKALRKKRIARTISIYNSFQMDSTYIHLVEIIPDHQWQDPCKAIASDEIINFLKKNLTRLQFLVFIMHISDFTYIEIAIRIQKDKKSVENALAKARKKLRKIISRLAL